MNKTWKKIVCAAAVSGALTAVPSFAYGATTEDYGGTNSIISWVTAYKSDTVRFGDISIAEESGTYPSIKEWYSTYLTEKSTFLSEQQRIAGYCSDVGYTDQANDVNAILSTGHTVAIYRAKTAYIQSVEQAVKDDIAAKAIASQAAEVSVPGASNATAASIDAYLSGSPLAGYGQVFYDAATANGLDPRLLPAISCIESSKGACCFRDHNAWGWGNVSWPDWTTAIYAMASGVANGYGSGATPSSMGPVYCPGSSSWIANVTSEMERI